MNEIDRRDLRRALRGWLDSRPPERPAAPEPPKPAPERRVVKLSDLTPDQQRLVLALIAARRASEERSTE